MKTELLSRDDALRRAFTSHCASADDIWVATAWATERCDVSAALWNARTQLRGLIVGLDFHQTDPAFLRKFRPFLRIGVAGAMVFHPKVYLFRKQSSFACIIGSSNLTGGGFGSSVEANVLVTGSTTTPLFSAVNDFINGLHVAAHPLRRTELAEYEVAYRRASKSREAITHFELSQRGKRRISIELANESKGLTVPDNLNVDWPDYVRLLLAQEKDTNRTIYVRESPPHQGYLSVLQRARGAFRKRGTLHRMTLEERRQVGGLASDFLYFGSMRGAGYFSSLVLHRPRILDRALDHIPASGPVDRRTFDQFARLLPSPNVKVATASRLLAMKRPDLFLCLDSKNRAQIAASFDVSQLSLTSFDGYWNLLLRIYECPWFSSPRPRTGIDAGIWDGRVALLDAFYYGR